MEDDTFAEEIADFISSRWTTQETERPKNSRRSEMRCGLKKSLQ